LKKEANKNLPLFSIKRINLILFFSLNRLDSDAFAAFKEKSLYDQPTAEAFRKNILERGGTGNPADMYRTFRGADPNPIYLMKKRGLN